MHDESANPPPGDTDAAPPDLIEAPPAADVDEADPPMVDEGSPEASLNNPAAADGPQDLEQVPGSAYGPEGEVLNR